MIKKVPQRLVDKIKRYNVSIPNKGAYKKILAGSKEEFLLGDKGENNIIVQVGTDARLNLSGSVKDTIFVLEQNATVDCFLKERSGIKNVRKVSVIVESGARFNLVLSTRDENKSNLEITCILVGTDGSVNIEEAISVTNFAETGRDILINHLAPHTESSYFARAIVDDNAKVGIKIKTIIGKKASKSIAHQLINNLILSDKAKAKGWPQLEINNDDVICNHALTVGHLNEEELFYASSRGIDRKKALSVIAEGFLQPIESKISDLKGELV